MRRRRVIADPDLCAFCGEPDGEPGDPLIPCGGELVHYGCEGDWLEQTEVRG